MCTKLWPPLSGRSRWVTATHDTCCYAWSLVHPGLGQQKKLPHTLWACRILYRLQEPHPQPENIRGMDICLIWFMIIGLYYYYWSIYTYYTILFCHGTLPWHGHGPSPSSSRVLPFCRQWGVDMMMPKVSWAHAAMGMLWWGAVGWPYPCLYLLILYSWLTLLWSIYVHHSCATNLKLSYIYILWIYLKSKMPTRT